MKILSVICFAVLNLLLAGCATGQSQDSASDDSVFTAQARAIHSRLFTLDTHVDIPSEFITGGVDPAQDGIAQVDFPKMVRGGLDCVFFSVAVGQRHRGQTDYLAAHDEALEKIRSLWRMRDTYPQRIDIAGSASQALNIHAQGKLVAAIGIENGFAVGTELARLQEYLDLGVSYISLAHLGHNDIGDSSDPVAELGDAREEHSGLSVFGREVVAQMNRLGIMVDVSHASKKTMLDILGASQAPVIASHSAVRQLVDIPRNMDDEQLQALKANGGVIQISGYSPHIRENSRERKAAINAALKEAGLTSHLAWVEASNAEYIRYSQLLEEIDKKYPRASVQEFVDHIDYVVRLIGIDHVGIGSDFYAGGGSAVGGLSGWMDATESLNVTLELLRRGYSEAQLEKIWGANLLRVWREVKQRAEIR